MPRPVEGMKASTVVVKSAPANFSFSLFLPCSHHAGIQYKLRLSYEFVGGGGVQVWQLRHLAES